MAEIKEFKRPKAGTYKTFTSRRGSSTICFQKPVYGVDQFKVRNLLSAKVTITIQKKVEFDVFKELLGDKDGKGGNPAFKELVTKGYLKQGEVVKLDPNEVQAFLEAQVGSSQNSIIYWEDRARTEEEKQLERVIKAKDTELAAKDLEIEELRKLLDDKTSGKR